jgi:hypothetical protein
MQEKFQKQLLRILEFTAIIITLHFFEKMNLSKIGQFYTQKSRLDWATFLGTFLNQRVL